MFRDRSSPGQVTATPARSESLERGTLLRPRTIRPWLKMPLKVELVELEPSQLAADVARRGRRGLLGRAQAGGSPGGAPGSPTRSPARAAAPVRRRIRAASAARRCGRAAAPTVRSRRPRSRSARARRRASTRRRGCRRRPRRPRRPVPAAIACAQVFSLPRSRAAMTTPALDGRQPQARDEQLARHDRRDHPGREDVLLEQHDERREHQQLVGHRVDERAEGRGDAAPPRDPPVEPVGRHRRDEDTRRPVVVRRGSSPRRGRSPAGPR